MMSGMPGCKRMAVQRRAMYLACEDLDFVWDEDEVLEFDRLWHAGASIYEIARHFRRDPDEVVILAIDRARQGFIGPRSGGVWGERADKPQQRRAPEEGETRCADSPKSNSNV